MKVSVLLPDWSRTPVGGFRVAYEHANWLANRGHRVEVLHVCTVPTAGMTVRLGRRLGLSRTGIVDADPVRWFDLHPGIEVKLLRAGAERRLPRADVLLLTDWRTAAITRNSPGTAGLRVQLVQDYEFWRLGSPIQREAMGAAFRSCQYHISTSSAVSDMLSEARAPADILISCGLDTATFRLTQPIEERERHSLGFPVRKQAYKGTQDAIAAADLVRRRRGSSLHIRAFGRTDLVSLPGWIDPVPSPSDSQLADFYNSISIFLLPSHFEGFGLPATEAMACGAALVCADSVGVRDFARDMETALLTPIGQPGEMADRVMRLLEDDPLRQRLARQGRVEVSRLSWEAAGLQLEQFLKRVLSDGHLRPRVGPRTGARLR